MDAGAYAVGVITFIGQPDGVLFEPAEQALGAGDVVVVARRDQQFYRPALGFDTRADFRRRPAWASADTTSSTLSLTPEAC
jgi:hypothetical protein